MNNPIMMLIQAAQGGGDPIQILGQMAGGNPMMAKALEMVQGKSDDELHQMAENMAKERGTSPEEVLQGLGINPRRKRGSVRPAMRI